MTIIQASLQGLPAFGAYFLLAIVFLLAFKYLYTLVTPYNEWTLIKDQQSTAAAVAYSGAIIGYAIAIGSAAASSVTLVDFVIWAVVGLIAQILAYFIVRLLFLPRIAERIQANEVSAGVILGGFSIAIGLLNAACMSY